MCNFCDGLKGVLANLQWAESEVPNRTLLDVSYPSFRLNLSRKSLVRDVKIVLPIQTDLYLLHQL